MGMHGYSPKASPDDKSKYQTDAIRTDTFKIADTVGFATFHLVGHDHGAVLGWRMATTDVPADLAKIKTYTAMSIPHIDVFSAALYGKEANEEQQVASQYFSAFVVEDSAARNNGTFFNFFKCARYGSCFETADDVQKALWWYNGIFEGGAGAAMSMPPDFTIEEIENSTSPGRGSALRMRGFFPELQADGFPQVRTIGDVNKPTLYVCGSKDTSILCFMDWALQTKDFCKAGYKYLELDCGHDLDTCAEAEKKTMHTEIVAFLSSNAPPAEEPPAEEPPAEEPPAEEPTPAATTPTPAATTPTPDGKDLAVKRSVS